MHVNAKTIFQDHIHIQTQIFMHYICIIIILAKLYVLK